MSIVRHLPVRIATRLALAIAACAACGGGQAAPKGNISLDDLRSFSGYAVYSTGSSFEGMPMTHLSRKPPTASHSTGPNLPTVARPDPEDPDLTTVVYGTCTPPPGDESGCPVPLSITSSSYCARPVEKTGPQVLEAAPFTYKGAAAGWVSGGLVLYFRDSTVNIIAAVQDHRAVEMRVADHLIAENARVISAARASVTEDFGPVTAPCTGAN
jgi:hypothetical protein